MKNCKFIAQKLTPIAKNGKKIKKKKNMNVLDF